MRFSNIRNRAFTIPELLVGITILTVLSTIAFISFSGYNSQARDAVRSSDIKSITTILNLNKVSNARFPEPTNPVDITYSGATVWTQGEFGEDTIRQTGKIFGDLEDPLYGNHYTYSVTNNKKEYQLGVYYENYSNEAELSSLSIENPFQINNAYASDPFSPLELNPIIWLDGEDVDGDGDTNDNPSNGGTISAWKNKSSAGATNDPVLSGGSFQYSTTGLDGAYPGVYVDDDTGLLLKNSDITQGDIFYVVQNNDPFGSNTDNNGRALQSADDNMLIGYWGKYRYSLYIDGSPSHYQSSPATKNGRTSYAFIYGFHTDDTNYEFRDAGELISNGAANSITGNEWAFNKAGHSNQKAEFVVSEILIFNSKLSTGNREKVEGYLAHKWGQEAWLPSGHTYKNDPPEGSGPPPTPDTIPDAFTLSDVTDADISTIYTSNSITVSGINQAAPISVSSGEYSKNGGSFTTTSGTVSSGDMISVRQTSSSSNSTATTTILNIGGVTEDYIVTTFVLDDTPDAFSFSSISDADVSTSYSSNSTTVSGLNTSVGVSVSGGDAEYSIAAGPPGDVTGVGSASASSTYSPNDPDEAFDNNTNSTGWGNNGSIPAWLKYDFGSGNDKKIQEYTFYRDSSQAGDWGNDKWSPKNWTFEGSSDNSSWDVLDTRTNQLISNDATKKSYSFSNSGYYRYYRINISAAYNSSSWVNITEVEMIDEGLGVFTSAPGTVENGDIISLRMTSSATAGTIETGTLTVGTTSEDFSITTSGPDTVPDNFSFTDINNATLSTLYTSNSITVAGINAAATISISGGGEYKINTGSYTGATLTVNSGDVITLRQTSAASNSQTVSSTLDIGGVSAVYNVTTPAPPPDTSPDAFSFSDVTGASFNTDYTSNNITVSGINTGTGIVITGGEYDINGSKSYTSSAGTINNGDVISVKVTSSPSGSTPVNATLTIGDISDTYTVTTQVADSSPDAFTISDVTGALINTTYESSSFTISGINVPTTVSISSGDYSINGGAFTSANGSINNGDSIIVRLSSSSSWNTLSSTDLNVGGVVESFQVTTGAGDTTPDTFVFSSVVDANLSTQYVSDTITITGLTAPSDISITDGEYRIGPSGSFTANAGTIENNQELTVRQVSPIVGSTTKNTIVDIDGVIGAYSVTTQEYIVIEDETPSEPRSNIHVTGEFNGLIAHAQNGDEHYILATPSIIATDTSNTDFNHIIEEKKLVYNGFENIPESYAGNDIDAGDGFDFAMRSPLLFQGSREDIGSYSGLKLIDEGVKSNYLNFPAYSRVSSYLDDFSLGYLERIIGTVIGINPIKPFYCSDILRSKLVTNIAPEATITASPSAYNSYGTGGIANGEKSTEGDLDYEYHSADPNASIEFEWDTPQKIGLVRIYNRTGCCSDRLTGAVVKLYNNFGGLIYSHPLWDTTDDFVISLDLEGIGHLHNVKKLTIETVGGNHLNLREVEIYLGGNIKDGIYKVDKDGLGGQSPYRVYCDMTTDGGGWTRIGENYIGNGDFAGQFHIDEHTFSGYNDVGDNLIVAHSTMAPPSYLPEAFVMRHTGTSSEAYPLYFPDIPGEYFAQEVRLRAWVKGTDESIFQNTINYSDSTSVSSQAEHEILETADNGWEYHLVRIPLEGGLVDDFTWDVGEGIAGPFYFTGLDMEVYYR